MRQELLKSVTATRNALMEGILVFPSYVVFTEQNYPLLCKLLEELLKEYPSITDFLQVSYYIPLEDGKRKEMRPSWIEFSKNPSFPNHYLLVFTSPKKDCGIEVVSSEEEKKE